VEVSILGILDPEQISHSLMESDALLSVRGTVYPRRGSAIAGVACGIPVVGYTDGGNIYPLSEAGLQVAPRGDQTALADALMAVLQNCELREELRARSRHAFETFFSWEVIARKLHQALAEPGTKE
jgi:glycosyltransferase involved in cell wall biosynthesis